jgi:hypothetical protein
MNMTSSGHAGGDGSSLLGSLKVDMVFATVMAALIYYPALWPARLILWGLDNHWAFPIRPPRALIDPLVLIWAAGGSLIVFVGVMIWLYCLRESEAEVRQEMLTDEQSPRNLRERQIEVSEQVSAFVEVVVSERERAEGMTARQFMWEPFALWDGHGEWRLQVTSWDVDDAVNAAVALRGHEASGYFWEDVARYLMRRRLRGSPTALYMTLMPTCSKRSETALLSCG